MSESFAGNRSHKLSIYRGYETSNDKSVSRNQSIVSKLTHNSQRLERIKSLNAKSVAEDTQLKFSTVPKNYSDLFSRNINVTLATLFENPKDPNFKHSDTKTDKNVTEYEMYKEHDVLTDISDDMLPSQSFEASFKYDEDCDGEVLVRPRSRGLTSSLLMFNTVANADEGKISSKKTSTKNV